jgi:hypothetical protein
MMGGEEKAARSDKRRRGIGFDDSKGEGDLILS